MRRGREGNALYPLLLLCIKELVAEFEEVGVGGVPPDGGLESVEAEAGKVGETPGRSETLTTRGGKRKEEEEEKGNGRGTDNMEGKVGTR